MIRCRFCGRQAVYKVKVGIHRNGPYQKFRPLYWFMCYDCFDEFRMLQHCVFLKAVKAYG
ncbi:MAG: hypothetical protein QXR42_08045 [Candidatus Bathyarchaeia archaeon]